MPAFHDIRFPVAISFGSTGGPERRTRIVTLAGGREERSALWSRSRRRYDAGLGLRSLDDLHAVLAFFEARHGRLHGFRWKDWSDYRSGPPGAAPSPLDQTLGAGDGVTAAFPLVKRYQSGAEAHDRGIEKPVAGSVRLALDGVETAAFTVDTATGIVTFAAAPPAGAVITAGFEFDVPVRFDADRLEVDLAGFGAGSMPSVPIVEIRP